MSCFGKANQIWQILGYQPLRSSYWYLEGDILSKDLKIKPKDVPWHGKTSFGFFLPPPSLRFSLKLGPIYREALYSKITEVIKATPLTY